MHFNCCLKTTQVLCTYKKETVIITRVRSASNMQMMMSVWHKTFPLLFLLSPMITGSIPRERDGKRGQIIIISVILRTAANGSANDAAKVHFFLIYSLLHFLWQIKWRFANSVSFSRLLGTLALGPYFETL